VPSRFELEIDRRLDEVREQHRVGQVTALVGNKLTVTTSGGGSITVSRLSTWTPAVNDVVLLAVTPAGWIAVGKILS
jgi:hypothetical protein